MDTHISGKYYFYSDSDIILNNQYFDTIDNLINYFNSLNDTYIYGVRDFI